MDDTGKTIAKNASFLMVSQLVTWSMSLLLMVFLPRYLGAASIGQLHLASSIWAIIGIFVSFGIGIMLTKEIARSKDKFAELAGTSLVIRIVFYFIAIGFLFVYLQFVNYSSQATWVIVIMGVSVFIGLLGSDLTSSLQGNERMQYIAYADVGSKFFYTVAVLVLLFLGFDIVIISTVLIGASLINLAIKIYTTRKIHPIKLNFRMDLVGWIIKASFPLLLVNIFMTIYIQIDVVIMSLLANEEVIGWYSAADSLFATLLFIPTIFLTAAFPALSRLHEQKSDALGTLMRKSFDMLMLLSIPIGLGMLVLGTEIVVLLFGPDFEKSGIVLSVMGIVLIFTYQNMLIGRFLIATNRQNQWTVVMALAMIISVPLDIVLIPWCQEAFGNGAIGGSLAFVITELGMMACGVYLLPRGSLDRSNIWFASRVIMAGIIMGIIVWQIRDLFIAIPILAGGIVYLGLILLFGVFPKEYLPMLQDALKTLVMKVRRKEAPVS